MRVTQFSVSHLVFHHFFVQNLARYFTEHNRFFRDAAVTTQVTRFVKQRLSFVLHFLFVGEFKRTVDIHVVGDALFGSIEVRSGLFVTMFKFITFHIVNIKVVKSIISIVQAVSDTEVFVGLAN